MADLEKVISGLKTCVNGECAECPYGGTCSDAEDFVALARDALELLKSYQPRVLTFDEVQNAPENSVVWHEINDEAIGHEYELLPFVGGGGNWFSPNFHNIGQMFEESDIPNYGKVFRCWSAKPTDAERRKVAWDE